MHPGIRPGCSGCVSGRGIGSTGLCECVHDGASSGGAAMRTSKVEQAKPRQPDRWRRRRPLSTGPKRAVRHRLSTVDSNERTVSSMDRTRGNVLRELELKQEAEHGASERSVQAQSSQSGLSAGRGDPGGRRRGSAGEGRGERGVGVGGAYHTAVHQRRMMKQWLSLPDR
jgi:hypothetical protein